MKKNLLANSNRVLLLSLLLVLALVVSACVDGTGTGDTVVEPEPLEGGIQDEPLDEGVVDQQVGLGGFGEFGVVGAENANILASNLLGYEVLSIGGEQLGTIDDMLLDLQTGNILFARIEHGGFLDIGDDYIAVPLSALTWDATTESFVIGVDEATFEAWPNLGEDWPDVTDPTWDDDLVTFWEDAGVDVFWDPTADIATVAWVSNVIDYGIDFGVDAGAGNVDDLVIDLSQGRAKYVVLSFDAGLFSEEMRAVPFSAFNASLLDTGEVLIEPGFDVTTLTDAPVITADTFGTATVFDETWDDDLDLYWEDAGFDVTLDSEDVADVAEEVAGEDVAITPFGVAGSDEDALMPVSAVLEREVENQEEEQLGFVDDLIVDLETGNVLFAIVEHGGFLDIGEDFVPVPLSAMALGPENDELILNVPETVFENYPDLGLGADWPVGVGDTWDDDIDLFWSDAGFDTTILQGVDPNLVARASDLVGYGVGSFDTPGLATADEMLVDLGQSRIEYVLLSFNDVDLYGEDWVVVPWQLFDPTAFGDEFVFDQGFDPTLLTDAPRLTTADLGDVDILDPTWDDEVDTYWQDYGIDVETAEDVDVGSNFADVAEEAAGEDLAVTQYGVLGTDPDALMLGTALIDREVENQEEQQLGFIDDLLIDVQTGNVLFALVEHGGFLDVGEERVPVPLSAMALGPENDELILNVPDEVFDNYPDLDLAADWPLGLDATWDDEIDLFWSDVGFDTGILQGVDPNMVIRATDLLDYGVDTIDTAELAAVNDMLVDLGQSRVEYALLAFADTDTFGEDLVIVPWQLFDPDAFGDTVVFDAGIDTTVFTDAPRLSTADLGNTDFFDPTWDDDVDTYWQDYGVDVETAEDVDVGNNFADVAEEVAGEDVAVTPYGITGTEPDALMLATNVLEREVENQEEEQLGFVDDLIVDLETGNVLFAIVEHGGFLDIGEDFVPVPLSAMALGPENDELILNVPEQVFENYPDLNLTADWPLGLDATWDDDIDLFWSDAGFDTSILQGVDPNMVARASNLVGYGVGTFDTPSLAAADDMIVDIGQSRIEYVLLAFNDVGVYGEDWVIVPWQLFDWNAFGDEIVFQQGFDPNLLIDAPRVTESDITGTDVFAPTWDDDYETFWGDAGFDVQ